MKKVIMPALLAVFLVWLMFFSNREKPAQMQTLAMGTLVDMTVLGLGGQTNYQVLQNAMLQLRELETVWHPDRIKPEGQALLAELNRRLQQGETVTVPQPLQQGFADAASYTGTSNGLFDPAIGGLVKLWGFHSDEQFPSAPPADADIQQALATPHFDDLLQNHALTGRADMRLDFGAFAKGLVLQEVADAIVAEYPQASLLLNGGGDWWRLVSGHRGLGALLCATRVSKVAIWQLSPLKMVKPRLPVATTNAFSIASMRKGKRSISTIF